MPLTKCPRCELNYLMEGEKVCKICRMEMKGEPVRDEVEPAVARVGLVGVVPGAERGLSAHLRRGLASLCHILAFRRGDERLATDRVGLELERLANEQGLAALLHGLADRIELGGSLHDISS